MTASHEPVRESFDEQNEIRSLLRTLTSGTVIDGKYRVDEVLGHGAMGVVVAATHLQLGERVALKFLRIQSPTADQDFQSRFRREARLSARLKSEHITRVIDVGVFREKVPFMVMEYLVGGDLRALTRWTGPLPLEVALDFATQICSGIAVAHAQGVVHRDLKSSNVFVTRRADGSPLLKILDFGISKWGAETESIELTKTGVVLGSPKYMAPEQLFGSSDVDARADVWSVGAIVYEMLTGKPPYDVPTVMRVCAVLSTKEMPPKIARDDVPRELEAALFRCFEREPADRVQNVAELAGSLLEAAGVAAAGAVRQRILATLDPASRDPLATSGANGLFATSGAFAIASTASMSTSRSTSRSAPLATPMPPANAPKESRGRALAWIAVALAAAAIAAFALRRSDTAAAPSTATGSAVPPATIETAVATATATATATTTATTTTTATATATATATTPRVTPPRTKPAATPKETATTTAAPPPIAATAPPTATPKVNPLGDRQ